MTDSLRGRRRGTGPHTPPPLSKLKLRERPSGAYSTEARGLSGSTTMTRREIEDEAKIMSVALNQPHWIGKTYHPSNGWMSTSLGCFCRDHWTSRETQKDYWDIGDRYAQIIDDERIARGLTPRQCAAAADPPKETTDEERADARRKAERALRDAEDEIRMVDNKAVRVLQRLCWDDLDIAANDVGRAFNGLYRLSVHFERLDTARRIR